MQISEPLLCCCCPYRCTWLSRMLRTKRINLIVFVAVVVSTRQGSSSFQDGFPRFLVSAFFFSAPISETRISSYFDFKQNSGGLSNSISERCIRHRKYPNKTVQRRNRQGCFNGFDLISRQFCAKTIGKKTGKSSGQELLMARDDKSTDSEVDSVGMIDSVSDNERDDTSDQTLVNGEYDATINKQLKAEISGNNQQQEGQVEQNAQERQQIQNWTEPTLAIAIPALIGMIADPLLSLMDTLYVSKLLGSIELAALGACTSIFHLAFNVFRATTAATTSLVASELKSPLVADDVALIAPEQAAISAGSSAGDTMDMAATIPSSPSSLVQRPETTDSARYVLSTTFQFSSIVGLFVALVLISSSTFSLKCMGIPQTSPLFRHATSYLRLRALAAPAVLFITVGEGAFRGYGDTRIPLLASMAAALTNAVLDPLLMFPPFQMGVGGAATATALSQVVAMVVYILFLRRRQMCMPVAMFDSIRTSYKSVVSRLAIVKNGRRKNESKCSKVQQVAKGNISTVDRKKVIQTIVEANVSMLLKQFSLLFCWAYATSRATNIGHVHVASHQVALSLWLVFALLQDGAAVASQVLMGRVLSSTENTNTDKEDNAINKKDSSVQHSLDAGNNIGSSNIGTLRSLTRYMVRLALIQSAVCSLALYTLQRFGAPTWLSTDIDVVQRLQGLMPTLMWFQPLVSLTLTLEGIATGAKQFGLLARGTLVATVFSMIILRQMTSVEQI